MRPVRAFLLSAVLPAAALAQAAPPDQPRPADPDVIRQIVRDQFAAHALNSLVYEVRIDGAPLLTEAMGEAMTGVPATTEGHFRNGAVALAYMAALALRLAEEGQIDLDTPIARWLPDLPGADQATIRMLANMTAGYPDHVANEELFLTPNAGDPFVAWSPEQLIAISLSTPRMFAPGTNWDYSHSGYVILGQVLEAATGQPMHALMLAHVLDPLDLTGTRGFDTAEIPAPVIHSFTAERGVWEDATYWNPSWTLAEGAIQVTTISDMARSFDSIVGRDGFLSPGSRAQMIDPLLIGFGAPLPGCPNCHRLTPAFSYGLGAILQDDWVFQTPSFAGYASAVATLPEERSEEGAVTIAVAVTYTQASFEDWSGPLPNAADRILRRIAAALVPENPPPMR